MFGETCVPHANGELVENFFELNHELIHGGPVGESAAMAINCIFC